MCRRSMPLRPALFKCQLYLLSERTDTYIYFVMANIPSWAQKPLEVETLSNKRKFSTGAPPNVLGGGATFRVRACEAVTFSFLKHWVDAERTHLRLLGLVFIGLEEKSWDFIQKEDTRGFLDSRVATSPALPDGSFPPLIISITTGQAPRALSPQPSREAKASEEAQRPRDGAPPARQASLSLWGLHQCGGNRRHEYNNNIEHREGFANLFQMSSIICGATNSNWQGLLLELEWRALHSIKGWC